MIFAILSTLTVLATFWTLTRAIRDRREIGMDDAMSMLAAHAVYIESLRITKHLLLTASVWTTVLGYPKPWLNTMACLLLGGTSILSMWFRHGVERRVKADKRAAASVAVKTSNVKHAKGVEEGKAEEKSDEADRKAAGNPTPP